MTDALPDPKDAARQRLALRRLPTQMRAQQTVELVLRAAAAEIEREGLDKLTTKRIAAAAGISVGALYEYFPSKEAIVHALVEQWFLRVHEAVDSVHPRHGGQRDIISYLNDQLTTVAVLYEGEPGLGALIQMLQAIPALDNLTRQHDDKVTESVSTALHHFAPLASAASVDAAARCIGVICHNVLCAAVVHRVAPAELLLGHLRTCLVAIASQLILGR